MGPLPENPRQREVMEVIYRLKKATVSQVLGELRSPPSYSAVRATMATLESTGYLEHKVVGKGYVYSPVQRPARARRHALRGVVETFFDGSVEDAVATLLYDPKTKLEESELDRLESIIENARTKQGTRK